MMTYREFKAKYYKIAEYWQTLKSGAQIEWTLWEHNELGDEASMIATNGAIYVYTQDDLETTVGCIEDFEHYRFEE